MSAPLADLAVATECSTLVDCLRFRADSRPRSLAYRYLETGDVTGPMLEWTWEELDCRADAIAATLQPHVARGDRVVLLFAPGLEFVAAFFGCLRLGAVAVPVPPPDPARLASTMPRLVGIIEDADPRAVLTTSMLSGLEQALGSPSGACTWLSVEDLEMGTPEPVVIAPEDLAFLQYTSGSTGTPKGVRVTHRNLIANLNMIERGYGITDSVARGQVVSWLPFYHDMGLIGVVLATAYVGGSATLMSPLDFLKRPARWLEAISHFQVPTMSGAPDFAYAHTLRRCGPEARAKLDLSNWLFAFCGAEPVRAETLESFADAFAPSGFVREAFRPSYGLAEATLFVSTGELRSTPFDRIALQRGVARETTGSKASVLVSCGSCDPTARVRIVAPGGTDILPDGAIGEVVTSGEHVSGGYWGKPGHPSFGVRLPGDSASYMRTGDLGFLHNGELYLSSRLKDLIIVRGRNLFPADLEAACAIAHSAVRPGGVAAFGYEGQEGECVAIMVETTQEIASSGAIAEAIREAVAERFGVQVQSVLLVPPRTIPRTTSGKIRRSDCLALWRSGQLQLLSQPEPDVAATPDRPAPTQLSSRELVEWMQRWIQERVRPGPVRPSATFAQAGLDSLNLVWLASDLEELLGFEVPPQALFGGTLKATAALLAVGREKLGTVGSLDLSTEADLDPTIVPPARPASLGDDPPIMVTGATGFVGSYLVEALLRRTSAPILCLARAAHDAAARERVLDALAPFELSPASLARVHGLSGDLSQPLLGLQAARFDAVADEVQSIYHCGAEIDWLKPYSSLAAVNVGGTREVIRLASKRGRAVHHVSTLGVYPLAEDAELPFSEQAPLKDGNKLNLGYAQSKWVAEKLLEQAMQRGLPVTIYRPSFVTGDSRDGREQASEHQLLYAFVAGSVQMGHVPRSDKVVDAVAVDWLGDAIAALSLQADIAGQRLNLTNPEPMGQRKWYTLLRARGYELREIAYARWRAHVLKLDGDNPLARFGAYYKLMDERRMGRLERQMAHRMPVETACAQARLAREGLTCPAFDEQLVSTYLDYYVGRALLPRPTDRARPASDIVLEGNERPADVSTPDPFDRTHPKLWGLYERSTTKQWVAESRIDWSLDVDLENPLELPDTALPLYGSKLFERATASERTAARVHYQAWQLSQFLYGEQAGVLAVAQLIRNAPNIEAQMLAAIQGADEARHLEIYTRLLNDKIGVHYPMVAPLQRLSNVIFNDGRWDVIALGVQILIEGLALSSFALMRDQSRNPLIRSIHAYVMEDEARHVGFGHRLLAPYYAELTDAERGEREEMVIEVSYLLRDRLLATQEVWEACGLPPERCTRWIQESGFQRAWGATLFSRIVPALRAIGLWSTRVQRAYGQMGLLGYDGQDLHELRRADERHATSMEMDRC